MRVLIYGAGVIGSLYAALTEIFWMQPLRLALFSQLQSACQVVVSMSETIVY